MSDLRKRTAYDKYRTWVMTARATPDWESNDPFGNSLGSAMPLVQDFKDIAAEPLPQWNNAAETC